VATGTALRCRECGREYPVAPIYTCEWCFGPLEATYDYDAIASTISRERVAAGPRRGVDQRGQHVVKQQVAGKDDPGIRNHDD